MCSLEVGSRYTYFIEDPEHLGGSLREKEGDDLLLVGQHVVVHHQAALVLWREELTLVYAREVLKHNACPGTFYGT